MYNFFYDETEHSRKVNYNTVSASNYCDNFIAVIVGWRPEEEKNFEDRYLRFEAKYDYRKRNGELKSQTMKLKDFKFGFASLNMNTIDFYEDLISLYNENSILYISVLSKIEYVINQLFSDYHNSIFCDVDYMKYSIIKAINVYRPQKVIESIYKEPKLFVNELRSFLKAQIVRNQANCNLKKHENYAFEEVLILLEDTEAPEKLEWSYVDAFEGFKNLLFEMKIKDCRLIIDREGYTSPTFNAAKSLGFQNVIEADSKEHVGIRMADMFAGLLSKLMQSLKNALTGDYTDGNIKKTLLKADWFELNQRQLELYKRLYRVVCENNNYWYKSYSGIYSDDLVAFVSFLQFMNHFKDADEVKENKTMQPEEYNTLVCENLQKRYKIMSNKLPIEFIREDDKDYFRNQRGAKVYKNIEKQPMLPILKGQNCFFVLSVGLSKQGIPLVTILQNDEPVCYRLPKEYDEWARTVIGMANIGESFFPENVLFSLIDGKYYADIL